MNQIDHVLEAYDGIQETPKDNVPLVPFKSDLQITLDQEKNLIDYVNTRMIDLESELGRDMVHSKGWWQDGENVDKGKLTFMGRREMYEAIYYNDVEWRSSILGGIFEKSNLVVPLARRIARQMIARANNYFFGSDPWFSARAEKGTMSQDLAEKIDQFAKFKLDQSGSKSSKENAVELAFVRGEAVMKNIYKVRKDYYWTTTDILVDVSANPITDSKGGFIFRNDRWVPQVLVDETTGQQEVNPNVTVLQRDQSIQMPEVLLWEKRRIRQSVNQFSGAESRAVYYKDFLCPLNSPSIEEADIVIHRYDMPLMDLAEVYRQRELSFDGSESASNWESIVKAVDLLRELTANDSTPKAAKDQQLQYDDGRGVNHYQSGNSNQDPIIEVAECYLNYDADGDGIREHIMLVYDIKSQRPIFYDYLANVTPDGLRPFSVIRPTEVDGRWYGIGAIEMFETTQQIVDLLVNRWNFAQSSSGRVTFWRPDLTMEGERDRNLKLNDGMTYTLKPGIKAQDVLQYVTLPDVKHEAIQNMFEFFLQMAMNESGVQHANDANAVGLDQAKLATGIRNIEKSGMEMFSIYISKLEVGIQETLRKEVNLIFANLAEEEVFDYFNGEQTVLSSINPDDVRDLDIYVSVLLTRYRGEQVVQQATAAIQSVTQFYQLPPLVQAQTAPMFKMFIKALDLNVDADEVIRPIEQPMPPGGGNIDGQSATKAAEPVNNTKMQPNL